MTKQKRGIVSFGVVCLLWACSGLSGPEKGVVYNRPPAGVDPKQKYLFYMHGAWLERNGLNTPHPRHGNYEYEKIVRALSDQGFAVISEPRLIKPMQHIIEDVHEIVGTGTLFPDEAGNPTLHMHMACGRNNHTVTGCVRGGVKVWQVMEVILYELVDTTGKRVLEPDLGLRLLSP